jgi:hypothetical protein
MRRLFGAVSLTLGAPPDWPHKVLVGPENQIGSLGATSQLLVAPQATDPATRLGGRTPITCGFSWRLDARGKPASIPTFA